MDLIILAALGYFFSGISSGLLGGAASAASAAASAKYAQQIAEAQRRHEVQKKTSAMINNWLGRR